MFQTFKQHLKHPTQNYHAKDLSAWQSFGYFLILCLIIALSLIVIFLSTFNVLQSEYKEITDNLPDFSIQDNTLSLAQPTDSFIYQGSAYVFYFDPNGDISQQTIEHNINEQNGFIGLGFFKDGFDVNVLDSKTRFSYEELDGISKADLIDIGSASTSLKTITLLLILPTVLIYFALSILSNTILSYLLTLFTPHKYSFKDRYKMSMTALTWPIIISSILHAFGLFLPLETSIITLYTLFIFYYGLRKDPNPLS